MSLPLFDRNRGNIDAARAEQTAAEARVLSARQDAMAERRGAVARLSSSTNRIAAADAGVTRPKKPIGSRGWAVRLGVSRTLNCGPPARR